MFDYHKLLDNIEKIAFFLLGMLATLYFFANGVHTLGAFVLAGLYAGTCSALWDGKASVDMGEASRIAFHASVCMALFVVPVSVLEPMELEWKLLGYLGLALSFGLSNWFAWKQKSVISKFNQLENYDIANDGHNLVKYLDSMDAILVTVKKEDSLHINRDGTYEIFKEENSRYFEVLLRFDKGLIVKK